MFVTPRRGSLLFPDLFHAQPEYPQDPDLKRFARSFVTRFCGPYAVQHPGGGSWKTKHKPVSDPLIRAHLEGQYWLGVRAAASPLFYFLDVDSPGRDTVDLILRRLGLGEGQFYVMTSPSFRQNGSCHIVLRLEHDGLVPSYEVGRRALVEAVGGLCKEVYPHATQKFRLPLGRDQHLIEDGVELRYLDWVEAMGRLLKLDPVPVTHLMGLARPERPRRSGAAPGAADGPGPFTDSPLTWGGRENALDLLKNGLQARGARHHAQWQLALYCYREDVPKDDAARFIKTWLAEKHNDYSRQVRGGALTRAAAQEIDRQVNWVYRRLANVYPDRTHNSLEGYVTGADLEWSVDLLDGEPDAERRLVYLKRVVKLICYYRARQQHPDVYIPSRAWSRIAHERDYTEFISWLESRGVLRTTGEFIHIPGDPYSSRPRQFRLCLPPDGAPIQRDGRNMTNFYDAWICYYGGQVSRIARRTGVHRQRFSEHKNPR